MTALPAQAAIEGREDIERKVSRIRDRIANAVSTSQFDHEAVRLIAASKTQSMETIKRFAVSGIRCFGENYLQEALPKLRALEDLKIEWHFIGHVQSNKAKQVASNFEWVQTLDSLKLAKRLNQARIDSHGDQPLNCCIQVNIDREPQKAGVLSEELPSFLDAVSELPGLKFRGLMAIPAPHSKLADRSRSFKQLRTLFDQARPPNPMAWDTLSVGMSSDYEEAIRCGANLIRLGTVLFGPRVNS